MVRRHKAFLWENDGAVKQEHVGKPGKPASRCTAGTIIMLDAAGVWVE
ncbi:MAG: hypothetical protein ACR5LG_12975 [Sodalis sp. (in: enterobacteria)]